MKRHIIRLLHENNTFLLRIQELRRCQLIPFATEKKFVYIKLVIIVSDYN